MKSYHNCKYVYIKIKKKKINKIIKAVIKELSNL